MINDCSIRMFISSTSYLHAVQVKSFVSHTLAVEQPYTSSLKHLVISWINSVVIYLIDEIMLM